MRDPRPREGETRTPTVYDDLVELRARHAQLLEAARGVEVWAARRWFKVSGRRPPEFEALAAAVRECEQSS